jgi:hypothetical protein
VSLSLGVCPLSLPAGLWVDSAGYIARYRLCQCPRSLSGQIWKGAQAMAVPLAVKAVIEEETLCPAGLDGSLASLNREARKAYLAGTARR